MLISIILIIIGTLMVAFSSYRLGAELQKPKLSTLVIKMLDEDTKYLELEMPNLTLENREFALRRLSGRCEVYERVIRDVLGYNQKYKKDVKSGTKEKIIF